MIYTKYIYIYILDDDKYYGGAVPPSVTALLPEGFFN